MSTSRKFLLPLLLALIAVNIELDIFLPALPQMQHFFGVQESTIEWVLSINFLGLCLSGVFCGYLSDVYGRKAVILIGMVVFLIGSVGCLLTSSISSFLLFRFIQGIGCGAPATVSFAAVCDFYSEFKATQVISFFNAVITSAMVGAPLLGIVLTSFWGWRSNFFLICLLALCSLILIFFCFEDTAQKRSSLQVKRFIREMTEILSSSKFWRNGLIAILMYASLIAFIANFPLIAANHLNLYLPVYGSLQALVMLAFVTGSFLGPFLLQKMDLEKMARLGVLLAFIGSFLFLFLCHFTASYLCLIAAIISFNFGAAFLIAIFSTRVIKLFEATGMASSLMGSLRMLIGAFFISISSSFFNGTFRPVGWLLFLGTIMVAALVFGGQKLKKASL